MKHSWLRLAQVALALLVSASCSTSMEYNRWKAIKAVDAEYAAGKISQKQHARKVASIRKAYAEYEAQWVANMKAQYAKNQQAMAMTGGSSSSGVYTYQPPPQFEYVQGPAHNPGGGYTPQPQFEYVNAPAHHPGGGYTPEPQQTYVQNAPYIPSGGYTPEPQQRYVQNAPNQPSGGYTPAPQTRYKSRSEMTPDELKALDAQTLKPYRVVNPYDTLATNVANERERNIRYMGKSGQKVLDEIQKNVVAAVVTKGVLKAATPAAAAAAKPTGFGAKVMNRITKMFKGEVKDHIESHSEPSKKKQ